MRLHTLHDMSGSHDLRLGAKTQHPRKELRADHHVRPDGEVGRAVGDDEYLAAQSVQNGTYQVIFKPHLYIDLFAGEHTEGFASVDRHVQRLIIATSES